MEPSTCVVDDNDDEDDPVEENYPMSILRCIELMQLLKNAESMETVVGLAAAFALTPDEHSEFTRKIDTGALRVPSRWTLQRAAMKLDYLSLLYPSAYGLPATVP